MLTPLYAPRPDGPMRVAGFMSGSGTNLVKVLEWQAQQDREGGSPYRVVAIFSDNPGSNAVRIGEENGIPVIVEDILDFYRSRGHPTKRDLSLRPAYDRRVVERLAPHTVDALVLAGYMNVVTRPLLEAFPGRIVNVHPADLRVLAQGKRKYTGDHAVRAAIRAGETALHSTTHIVREEVDGGEILMVSPPVPVRLPEGIARAALAGPEHAGTLQRIADEHQERLKRAGDWVVLPRTLHRMALGRYSADENGRIHLDGSPLHDPQIQAPPP